MGDSFWRKRDSSLNKKPRPANTLKTEQNGIVRAAIEPYNIAFCVKHSMIWGCSRDRMHLKESKERPSAKRLIPRRETGQWMNETRKSRSSSIVSSAADTTVMSCPIDWRKRMRSARRVITPDAVFMIRATCTPARLHCGEALDYSVHVIGAYGCGARAVRPLGRLSSYVGAGRGVEIGAVESRMGVRGRVPECN